MKVKKLNEVTFLLKCFREKYLWITFKSVMSLRLAIMEIYRHCNLEVQLQYTYHKK